MSIFVYWKTSTLLPCNFSTAVLKSLSNFYFTGVIKKKKEEKTAQLYQDTERIAPISLIQWQGPITSWTSHKGYGICFQHRWPFGNLIGKPCWVHESHIMNERDVIGTIDPKNNNMFGHKIKLEDRYKSGWNIPFIRIQLIFSLAFKGVDQKEVRWIIQLAQPFLSC